MERDCEHFKGPDIRYLQDIATVPMWIIEYAWAQKKMEILEGLNPSLLPVDNLGSLTLEEPWRLSAAAAQAWSIVRARDVARFCWVLDFLEVTYGLLPTLVAPIKHMKIMFGLKTMIIMWMLREDQCMVTTVRMTIQMFPSRLPLYQGCRQHQMYLMRKNHQDFKTLAQRLAMDRTRRQAYIKHLMEEQYGETYAKKLEDRLIHYLHQLDTVLPKETYIDQLLKKERSSLLHEEQLLMRLVTSDPISTATSLNRILLCGPSSSCAAWREGGEQGVGEGVLRSSEGASEPSEVTAPTEARLLDNQESVGREEGMNCGGLESQDRTMEEEDEELEKEEKGKEQEEMKEEEKGKEQEEEDEEKEELEEEGAEVIEDSREAEASPMLLCFRHQRWVRNILHECPEEQQFEKELPPHNTPHLIPSSTSSSENLTPSVRHPPPLTALDGETSGTSSQDLTPSLLHLPTDLGEKPYADPPTSVRTRPCSTLAGGTVVPTHPMSLRQAPSRYRQVPLHPHHITQPKPWSSRNKRTPSLLPPARPLSQEASAGHPRLRQLAVRLHRLETTLPTLGALVPQTPTFSHSPVCVLYGGDMAKPPPQLPQPQLLRHRSSPAPSPRPQPSPRLRLFAGSQSLLLQSSVLQPRLPRLLRLLLTKLPPQQWEEEEKEEGNEEPQEEEGEEEYVKVDFDVNTLYSSSECGSDEDRGSQSSDPDYSPSGRELTSL